MEKHLRTAAILNILFGLGSLLGALMVLVVIDVNLHLTNQLLITFVLGFAVFHLVTSIPSIALGYLLLSFNPAGRSPLTVLSILQLLSVPVGTVVAAYTLWTLLAPESDPLFDHHPRYLHQGRRS